MNDELDELVLILAEIRRHHGTVQAITAYAKLMWLHDLAEIRIANLRRMAQAELEDDDLPHMRYGEFEYFD